MKLRVLPLVILSLSALAALVACAPGGPGGDAGPGIEPKLSVIKQEILSPSCATAACHGGENPANDLALDVEDLHGALVGVDSTLTGWKYVVAGEPENSLLLQILKGSVETVPQMPSGATLSAEKIQAIEEWIQDGAAND